MHCGRASNRRCRPRRHMQKGEVAGWMIDEHLKRSSISCAPVSSGMRCEDELGASSTVHDRFQEWEQAGFFMALWQAGLRAYDELEGIQWEWQAVDGAMTK